jgi:hypothetical protein
MDITLQNHRAVNMATQLMNNPVVDITSNHQKSQLSTAAVGTNHAAANHTAVTPIAVPKIKKEPNHPKSRRTLFSKPRATSRTFEDFVLPRMNLVSTCHNYSAKHAWTLGKETIAALAENGKSFINTRLAKLAFPHKQDNVKSLKFVSAVFIGHNNSNFSV